MVLKKVLDRFVRNLILQSELEINIIEYSDIQILTYSILQTIYQQKILIAKFIFYILTNLLKRLSKLKNLVIKRYSKITRAN